MGALELLILLLLIVIPLGVILLVVRIISRRLDR
jgi:hypothetical protein